MEVEQVLDILKQGADAHVSEDQLPPMVANNSKELLQPEVGELYTDQLATFIKKGHVAGPFDSNPLENLRINSIFSIDQGQKIRPIMNLSHPAGTSYNDAVLKENIPKVHMNTAQDVAKTIGAMGKGAIMSKVDQEDAYKQIHTKKQHLRLQGFSWLGKIFIELKLVFGSISAVHNYDIVHKVFSNILRLKTEIEPEKILRILDDFILITPSVEENKMFMEEYIKFANACNIPLAPTSKPDKSFLYKTEGKLLGIIFNTKTMSWALPKDKADKYQYVIQRITRSKTCTSGCFRGFWGS